MKIPGGCLCGGTRYELTEEPFGLGNCHCIDCQRSTGAPFVTWGSVPAAALRLTRGELTPVYFAQRVRSFARCCHTPLFFAETTTSSEIDVAIATLDNPRGFPPRKNIWTEDRLPWVTLDPAIPVFLRSSRADAEP